MENIRMLPVTYRDACTCIRRSARRRRMRSTGFESLRVMRKLDRHNSIMDPDTTTLKNFEKDAKAKLGVALKDHHGF